MPIKVRRLEEREQLRTATEKMKHCLIFYVSIVLCLNILLPIIRFDYTTKPLLKHDDAKKCVTYTIFNHRNRIIVANFQVLDHSENYRILKFNVRTIIIVIAFGIDLSQYNSLLF